MDFACVAYVCCLLFAAAGRISPAEARRGDDWRWLVILGVAVLTPATMHLIAQVVCIKMPRRNGALFSSGSVGMLVVAAGTMPEVVNQGGFAAAVPAFFVVVSFGLWLTFLARLGHGLRDRELIAAINVDVRRFALGLVGVLLFLALAYLAEQVRAGLLVWGSRVGAAVIGFLMLRAYSALLRTATEAVERRAPVVP